MILGALRLFKSLSYHHYRTVALTVLLPAIVPTVFAYLAPESLMLQVAFYVAGFLVWSVLAVLAVASMLKKDSTEAEQLVDQKLETHSRQIRELTETQEDLREGLNQQIKGLEETVRTTLKEELGVALPPRPIFIRSRETIRRVRGSAILTMTGGSKLTRLRQWLRRAMWRLLEVVYGKPEGTY